MNYRNLQTRICTGIRQCKTMLENHHREYQIFHDGCPCGSDCDEGSSIDNYDTELCFKVEEANLASLSMHDWFDDAGKFKSKEIQHEVIELFSYCTVYADKRSPILEITLKQLIKEIERMDLEQAHANGSGIAVVTDLDLWRLDTRRHEH